jgi:hypothetical protein
LLSCSSGEDPPETCSNISGAITEQGLTIRKPEEDVAACREVANPNPGAVKTVCEKVTPDLACVGTSEPFGAPIMVTFTGCVASFGLEAQSDDLTVTIMREQLAGGSTPVDPGYDLNGQAGMQTENTPSAFIAKTLSTLAPAAECVDLGTFTIANIPTETDLIVRVTDQHLPKSERAYVDTYQYNIALRNSLIRSGPMKDSPLVTDPATFCAAMGNTCYVVDDVNTINEATFKTVALAAGVSNVRGDDDLYDGDGQGHLAGEVQDCSSVDTVQNAVVAVDAEARKQAYFNVGFPPDPDNLEDPKVEGTRTRTNGDGLYAAIALDVPMGGKPVKAGAAITKSVCGADNVCKCGADGKANPAYTGADTGEGETLLLGTRTVYVYPDSITIMTFDRQTYVTR